MNDCKNNIELISALVDGELTAEQEAELRTHIDQCKECKRVYDAFAGLSDGFSDDLAEPPESLAKGIMFKINLQEKGGTKRHFVFGRFTAIAACLVLILFGASRFGLLDSLNLGASEPSPSSNVADERSIAMDSSLADANTDTGEKFGTTYEIGAGETEQTELTAGEAETECGDGTVLQMGFPTHNLTVEGDFNSAEEEKEPSFLFDAKELRVYEGKYYSEKENQDKNNLLFSLTTEEDLRELSKLLAAVPDDTAEYSPEDKDLVEDDPLFTLFIPADREKDEEAKDKIICIWFVKGDLWCVIEDSVVPDDVTEDSTEKILYKASGLQNEFEDFVKKIDTDNNIT